MTTRGTTQNLNQFEQNAVRGSSNQQQCFNHKNCVLNNASDSQITSAGDLVCLVAGGKYNIPTVAEVLATDDASSSIMYGFVRRTLKQNQYTNNDQVSIAFETEVMRMEAGEAINCGDRVAYDATQDGVIVKEPVSPTTGIIPCGTAQSDVASGELFDVYIKF